MSDAQTTMIEAMDFGLPRFEQLARAWQPIETAPKDGTVVLVWDGDEVQTAKVYSGEWWATGELTNPDGLSMECLGCPTHWMRLPTPPSIIPEQLIRQGDDA